MSNKKENKRLLSLDVLRGITVTGMILVNNVTGDSFLPLKHSEWNGMTPCDLVFPFFLYIMGITTFLSLYKYEFNISSTVIRKITKRTIIIFLIGLGSNWLSNVCGGDWGVDHLRIMGVLQRIAICYWAVSLLSLLVNHKYCLHIALVLLTIYIFILIFGNGYTMDESNIVLRIDKAILGTNHLYKNSLIEPEGIVSTIAAIAHTLIGFWCGRNISIKKTTNDKILFLLLTGAIFIFTGYFLSYSLPLNKSIWSPSYVLMTTGLASLLQGILMYFIDIRHHYQWVTPFQVFGVNPLFLYIISEALSIIGWNLGFNSILYNFIHTMITNDCWASFIFAFTHVVICWVVGWVLYQRKIIINI